MKAYLNLVYIRHHLLTIVECIFYISNFTSNLVEIGYIRNKISKEEWGSLDPIVWIIIALLLFSILAGVTKAVGRVIFTIAAIIVLIILIGQLIGVM